MMKSRRTLVAIALCAFAMLATAGQGAIAGEIGGNGVRHDVRGKSLCAFSGQNDEFHEQTGTWPRVQSFGQGVKVNGPMGGVPGFACNPSGHR